MSEAWVFKVYGLVQGVGFRFYAKTLANKLGISGWTKNQASGYLETLVQGRLSDLEIFEKEFLLGPKGSRIDHWEKRNVPLRADLNAFSILGP